MTDYEQAYRDQRAALRTLAYDMRRGWKHVSNGSDAATLVEKTLASSAPATAREVCGVGGPREASSDCIRAPHRHGEHEDSTGGTWPIAEAPRYATASESATECNCGYGGFHEPLNPLCQVNIRDADPGVTSSDGDRGLSEEVEAIIRAYGDPVTSAGRESLQDTVGSLVDLIAARTAQPEGVERVEWGVRHRDGWVGGPSLSREAAEQVIAEMPLAKEIVRRTVTIYAPVVGPWEVVGDE